MKTFYNVKNNFSILAVLAPFFLFGQQPTTVVPSANCSFTYNFNLTDEGFSAPSIYSDANDLGLYWNGTLLIENSGINVPRTASVISGIYLNTESARTTIGFDYTAPVNTEYRVRIITGATNPPLEILATTATGPVWTLLPSPSGSLCLELQDADLPLIAQIRYEITFRATVPGNITIDNFRKTTFNSPLPVTFLGFIARENTDGTTRLLWNVATESNVRGYEVEASSDGINFNVAGFVPAAAKANYSFDYTQFSKGNIYFRVRNVDFDNKHKYTGIIKVKKGDQAGGLKVYPVPATDQVYIEHPKTLQKTFITIVSSEGKVLYKTSPVTGSYQTSINIRTLGTGIYFVKYEGENGVTRTTTFIKN